LKSWNRQIGRNYELRESKSRGSHPTGVWRAYGGGKATSPKSTAKGKTENWCESSKTQKGAIMRPMSEQEIWNENVANMRLKLAPIKDFEGLLNEPYDPIANALRRHPKLTEEEAVAMAKAFGF
jgi:hypothetical protein